MLHLDSKKLGIGWEHTHITTDDHLRLAYSEVLADETAETTAGVSRREVACCAAQGILVERPLTDNGSAYRSTHYATVALEPGISKRFTQSYCPQRIGKAERLIRALLTAWPYATMYDRSARRTAALSIYLAHRNVHRRHSTLNDGPPASCLLIAM